MIRAVCLNPTIDRNYFIREYAVGKLYRNTSVVSEAAGKGLNTAKVVSQLGESCVCYGFIGEHNSEKILETLKLFSIGNGFITIPGETRTTVNVIDQSHGMETEIIEAGPFVSDDMTELLVDSLRREINPGDVVLCSGLPAPNVPNDIYIRISKICETKGAYCILDTNGKNLRDSLDSHYLMIKPNARELCEIMDRPQTESKEELSDLAAKLLYCADHVLVSMGGHGGILVNRAGAWFLKVPTIQTVNTIGSGDSVVAGFAVAWLRNKTALEAACFGLACGTANANTASVAHLDLNTLEHILPEIQENALPLITKV